MIIKERLNNSFYSERKKLVDKSRYLVCQRKADGSKNNCTLIYHSEEDRFYHS